MKTQSKLLLLVGALLFSLLAWISAKKSSSFEIKSETTTNVNPLAALTLPAPIPRSPTSLKQDLVEAVKNVAGPSNGSLTQMLQTLNQFTQVGPTMGDLLIHLKKQGENPLVASDNNPYTGTMTIVRTNTPPPGTRYFHAQYFSNESGDQFVQHMSFEYKPSPTAMTEVVSLVEQSFANLGAPTVRGEDYMQWNLGDDHIVWVKKMAADDLKDDPFNSYSPEDIGTIRVAVELEIHEREHEH